MNVQGAFFTKKGRHEKNEDAVLPGRFSQGSFWAAVADGMGGHEGGEVASAAVIEEVERRTGDPSGVTIAELFESAHRRLREIGDKQPNLRKMGTTLSLVQIRGDTARVGHVGDSRIYHLRADGILDRTVDQTEVRELIERGVLRKADAKRYPRRNVLLSVLSPDRNYELYETAFQIARGDRILLLTDGVSTNVMRREIRDMSLAHRTPQLFCDALVGEIKTRLPEDDYTAVCLDITD
jgi:serine/threonine protein phosphatase PrpC